MAGNADGACAVQFRLQRHQCRPQRFARDIFAAGNFESRAAKKQRAGFIA